MHNIVKWRNNNGNNNDKNNNYNGNNDSNHNHNDDNENQIGNSIWYKKNNIHNIIYIFNIVYII